MKNEEAEFMSEENQIAPSKATENQPEAAAVTRSVLTQLQPVAAETPVPQKASAPAPSSKPSKQRSKSKGKKKKSPPSLLKQFAACGRCSFFWAGYKLIDETFDETAVSPNQGWLTLSWNHSVRDLVHKSFGNRLDLDFYYYEGCCSACQRPFIFQGAANDNTPARLRVRL